MADEENTKEFENARPILERILARLDSMDERLSILEAKSYDTRPMWEEFIKEMREGFARVERKLDVMNHDLLEVRAEQRRIDKRMDQLERPL